MGKKKKKESPYLDWIRSLPCGRCPDQKTVTYAHHLKMDLHQSGAGMRADDLLAMPLCLDCHSAFHGAKWGDDWRLEQRGILLLTLIQAMNGGIITMDETRLQVW